MNAPVHTRTFKSGNSVAVRLPKQLGVASDENVLIIPQGRDFLVRRVVDPIEEKRKLMELIVAMDAIGPVGEIEVREPLEFPDRRGL